MKCVLIKNEKKGIRDFLSLPKKLYTKKDNMEDAGEMKKILLGTHPLSSTFSLYPFVIYQNEKAVGRFAMTVYPKEKKTCYIGFFECTKDKKVAKKIFDEAALFAKEHGFQKIVGPVDASFWLKYRLKISKFDRPYTGEPYNLDYYYKFFLENQFHVVEHYTSNLYESVDEKYNNPKFQEHFKEFEKLGYEIVKPKDEDFQKCMEEIYYLIMDLYSDFPVFRHVEKETFMEVFSSYKKIINMDMVRMAYFKGKAVGFYISVPDYHNLVYHVNPISLFKILHLRKKPNRYVMLYMGVDQKHIGLGKALVYSIVEELKKSHLVSIGALARDGKITQRYAEEVLDSRYEYVLLERKIK